MSLEIPEQAAPQSQIQEGQKSETAQQTDDVGGVNVETSLDSGNNILDNNNSRNNHVDASVDSASLQPSHARSASSFSSSLSFRSRTSKDAIE